MSITFYNYLKYFKTEYKICEMKKPNQQIRFSMRLIENVFAIATDKF